MANNAHHTEWPPPPSGAQVANAKPTEAAGAAMSRGVISQARAQVANAGPTEAVSAATSQAARS